MKELLKRVDKVAVLIVLNLFLCFYSIIINSSNLAMLSLVIGFILVNYHLNVNEKQKVIFESKVKVMFLKYCLKRT